MCMQVDEAGGDDQPVCVDRDRTPERVGRQRRDRIAVDPDVEHSVGPRGGIHYASAGQDHVVHRFRGTRGARAYGERGDEGARTHEERR